MDKYEYKLKTEQMLKLMENGAYNRAAEIADSIDWKRVRNVNEKIRDYRKSFGVLRAAYHRTEGSRKILYRLCTLAIKVGNLEEAIDYYDEYVQAAPKDPNQYILRYRLLRARRAPIEQQIRALEQFKKAEYVEEWAYELAKRYEEAGMTAECLEECDDLILWFSEGKYVYKAMELKMRYKPLTPLQQEKYDRRLEEAEKSSEREAKKLIDLGRIKAEEEEKRRKEQEEAARYTEDMLERSEQIAEPENAELSEEEVAEQLKKAEPPKKKLGDTMKLGEALQNLFHTEKEEAQEQEELELSEEDAEEYEEDIEELAEEDAELVEGDDEESTGEDDCSDLAEALEEIESLSDLELLDQVTEEEPVEEIIEETIETKVKEVDLKELEELAEPEMADAADVEVIEEPEVAEEAEKEDMEKESILFTPGKIGPLTLRNRTIRAAAFESMCPGNAPSDMLYDYHKSVASGGIGMTTLAYAAVTQSGLSFERQLWMRPDIIPGLKRITDAIHKEGAAASVQLGHCGNMSHKNICGCRPISASSGFNI